MNQLKVAKPPKGDYLYILGFLFIILPFLILVMMPFNKRIERQLQLSEEFYKQSVGGYDSLHYDLKNRFDSIQCEIDKGICWFLIFGGIILIGLGSIIRAVNANTEELKKLQK